MVPPPVLRDFLGGEGLMSSSRPCSDGGAVESAADRLDDMANQQVADEYIESRQVVEDELEYAPTLLTSPKGLQRASRTSHAGVS